MDEVHAAEAARVVEADAAPRVEHDLDVIVGQALGVGLEHAQVPRHAEVHEQGPRVGLDQEVLGPAPDRADAPAGQLSLEGRRQPPAQAPLGNPDRDNPPAPQDGLKAAARRFDFGEFRHFLRLCARLRL